jgi:hypothetical protein
MLQGIEFKVELTLSLHFFVDFKEHVLEHDHTKNGHKKQATLSV